jgi:hypothetical protein
MGHARRERAGHKEGSRYSEIITPPFFGVDEGAAGLSPTACGPALKRLM